MTRLPVLLLALLVLAAPASARREHPNATARSAARALERAEARHDALLALHRPDLAQRFGVRLPRVTFVPLNEATLPGHVRDLEALLAGCATLPAGARTDSLRARLEAELAESRPGGALRRDALLWLGVLHSAADAPWGRGIPGAERGCGGTTRAALQLRAFPEAVRAAAVLLRGVPPPPAADFESRVGQLERFLRHDLPLRTEACKESRRLAEFAEADSLAAASLAEFRRLLMPPTR